jgi:hypothetical protein
MKGNTVKTKLMALALILLLSTMGWGASYIPYLIDIVDQQGAVIADANFAITIQDAGTTDTATILASDTGVAKTNPVAVATDTSAAAGRLLFWSAATSVDVSIASGTYTGVVRIAGVKPTTHQLTYPLNETTGNISVGTLTASGAAALNGTVGLGNAVTDNITVTGAIQGANALYFDGATDNTIETIFAITDPISADKTITFQAVTGTVPLDVAGLITMPTNGGTISNAVNSQWILGENSEDLNLAFGTDLITVSSSTGVVGINWGAVLPIFPGAVTCNGAVTLGDAVTDITTLTGKIAGATPLTFDGATANTVYTIFAITDPTSSSKTITFPARTGTARVNSVTALTPTATPTYDLSAGTVFTLSPTDNEDETITGTGFDTVSGATVTIVVTSIGASADEILTFGTGFKTSGTLTISGTTSKVMTITFVSDGTQWVEVSRTAAM